MRFSRFHPFLLLMMSACSTADSSPLVFGQGVTVGINIGTSPANANMPEIAIGVKTADIAIVPTVVPNQVSNVESDDRKIVSIGSGAQPESDALSTFGSFSNETELNSVKLGIFFATGVAAQNLSNGFKCALGPAHFDCSGQSTNSQSGNESKSNSSQ